MEVEYPPKLLEAQWQTKDTDQTYKCSSSDMTTNIHM